MPTLPPNPLASVIGGGTPPASPAKLPPNPVAAHVTGQALSGRVGNEPPSRAVVARTPGHGQSFTGGLLDAANAVLGLANTNTKDVTYAAEHPLGRLQEKGVFSPTQNPGAFHWINLNGRRVPVEGGTGDIPWMPGAVGEKIFGKAANVALDPRLLSTLREQGLPVAHLQVDAMTRDLKAVKRTPLTPTHTAVDRAAAVKTAQINLRRFKQANASDIRAGRASGLRAEDVLAAVPHHLSVSTLNGIEGANPASGKWAQDLAATKGQEANIRRIVEEGQGTWDGAHYGPGGYGDTITPSAQVHVLAAPEQADRIAQRLADEYSQHEVWATRPGVSGPSSRFSLELESTAFSSKAGVEKFWKALQGRLTTEAERAHLAGFAPYAHVDAATGRKVWGMRIVTGHGALSPGGVEGEALLNHYADRVDAAAADAGLPDIHSDWRNVEVRSLHGQAPEVHAEPAGAGAGAPLDVAGGHAAPEAEGSAPHAAGAGSGARAALASAAGAVAAHALHAPHMAGDVGNIAAVAVPRILHSPAVRSPEEASAHVLEQANAALAEGHGTPTSSRAPEMARGTTSELTGGELGAQVRDVLHGRGATDGMGEYEKVGAKMDNPALGETLPKARAIQEDMRAPERARRAALVARALGAKDVKWGYAEALRRLRGALPRVNFEGFKQFDDEAVKALMTHIAAHPLLRPYEKVRAMGAIVHAVEGKLPTASEQRLLEIAFGREVGDRVGQTASFWARFRSDPKFAALEVLNLPRALMASFDLSAPFRQGLLVATSHPGIFFRNFAPMIRGAKSEEFYQGAMHDIYARPTYPLMQKYGLQITDIGEGGSGFSEMEQREEQFMGNLAEHLPGVGRIIRGSDRAYVLFLNKTRADLFDRLVHQAASQGHDLAEPGVGESIAKFVNSATGRGDLGALQKHAVTLNATLFSPRLLASRFNMINPLYYKSLDPFARKQALLSAATLVGTGMLVLQMAKMAGAQVSSDPSNADFGKIRIGDTRIDIWGGFQQEARLIGELATGKITSSTSGAITNLAFAPGKYSGKTSYGQPVVDFFRNKLSPIPGVAVDLGFGPSTGGALNVKSEALSHITPLMSQDFYSILQDGSLEAAIGGGLLSGIGVGVQTYGSQPSSTGGGGGAGADGFGGGAGGFDTGGGFGSSSAGGFGG